MSKSSLPFAVNFIRAFAAFIVSVRPHSVANPVRDYPGVCRRHMRDAFAKSCVQFQKVFWYSEPGTFSRCWPAFNSGELQSELLKFGLFRLQAIESSLRTATLLSRTAQIRSRSSVSSSSFYISCVCWLSAPLPDLAKRL